MDIYRTDDLESVSAAALVFMAKVDPAALDRDGKTVAVPREALLTLKAAIDEAWPQGLDIARRAVAARKTRT